MFATQLVRSNNVLSLLVDPAKTLVTRQWLFNNGFKINNYKTRDGITTFAIRSYTAAGFAKLTAKYPVNAPVFEVTCDDPEEFELPDAAIAYLDALAQQSVIVSVVEKSLEEIAQEPGIPAVVSN